MTAQVNQFRFSVKEYHKLAEVGILKDTDRVELIEGKIIDMSPINSLHASTVDDVYELLILLLHGKAIIKGQNPIHISDNSEPEPDIVIAHFNKHRYRSEHPTPKDIHLVIEVSDSTLAKDRELKTPLYATAEIPEYWIINLVDRQIEIHRQPKNGDYHFKQIISEEGDIKCEAIDFVIAYSYVFK